MKYEVTLSDGSKRFNLGRYEANTRIEAEKKAKTKHKALFNKMQTNNWQIESREVR